MKTVYSTINGEPVVAHRNPARPGSYLIPANSTEFPPPTYDNTTQTVRYENSKWIVEDLPIETVENIDLQNPGDVVNDAQQDTPQYILDRLAAYGTIDQQLEYITEHGVEAWQQKVAEIKALYPKPEETV